MKTSECHFFNNEKSCPFDAECVFLHENSGKYKFGGSCERNYCLFKHEKKKKCEENDIIEGEKDIVILMTILMRQKIQLAYTMWKYKL